MAGYTSNCWTADLYIADKDNSKGHPYFRGGLFGGDCMRLIKDNRGSILVEFAICGIMFIGFVMGMVVMGIWIYNTSQVSQAARIAAHNVAVTNDLAEAQNLAMEYLNKTLIACPTKGVLAYSTEDNASGVAEAYMTPLFPGFEKLVDPRGESTINGRIHIKKEATRVREYRYRPGSQQQFN